MTLLPDTRRLWWHGRSGAAILNNLRLNLSMPPAPFPQAQYIDYAPEARIRIAHGPMRAMTADEIAIAEAFLRATLPPPLPTAA